VTIYVYCISTKSLYFCVFQHMVQNPMTPTYQQFTQTAGAGMEEYTGAAAAAAQAAALQASQGGAAAQAAAAQAAASQAAVAAAQAGTQDPQAQFKVAVSSSAAEQQIASTTAISVATNGVQEVQTVSASPPSVRSRCSVVCMARNLCR
jgi:hypothetical protein